MSARTESEIVQAACNGDVDSFGQLYRRYYGAMVWLAFAHLPDRNLAEDAAQETFAAACHELGCLKKPEKFAKWLAAICRNVARRMAKQRTREVVTDDPPEVLQKPEDGALKEAVNEAIASMPRLYREPVVLHYFSGMSYEQVAAVLGIPAQRVKGRLFRARRKMARFLKNRGFDEVE